MAVKKWKEESGGVIVWPNYLLQADADYAPLSMALGGKFNGE